MAKRFEVHVLVNAGRAHVGQWVPLFGIPTFSDEVFALQMVEKFRENDRWATGLARSYRVVEKRPVNCLDELPVLRVRGAL